MSPPAIVVVAFNRPTSLKRLLKSVEGAVYTVGNIPLIISIDYEDSELHSSVESIAKTFHWQFGKKEIIAHSINLGLKEHVLRCGDLVKNYGSIIMLEDDLYVSPYFYTYASEALIYYKDTHEVGGISLYNHRKNFVAGLPFEPIPDATDIYFLQIASSWGQCWTEKQWTNFRTWHDNEEAMPKSCPLSIRNWPETSWLKYFIGYLVSNSLYFVYPNKSLSTNFADGGTHNLNKNVESQVPLYYGNDIEFVPFEDAINIYDSYFEIIPECLDKLTDAYRNFNYSMDLYGKKDLKTIQTEFLFSSKEVRKKDLIKFSKGLEFKPLTLNAINNPDGTIFSFSKTENFENTSDSFSLSKSTLFDYFFTKMSIAKLVKILFFRIKSKLFKI